MFLAFRAFVQPKGLTRLLPAAVGFAAGLAAATVIGFGAAAHPPDAMPGGGRRAAIQPLRSGHPADVLRVLDGDTFEARVHIWPGMDITTKIRLRGIDAPEMRARCPDERTKAEAAREALIRVLGEGSVAISNIGQDKYGGRVDADVSTARIADVAAAMLESGHARRYGGGRRASWCTNAVTLN